MVCLRRSERGWKGVRVIWSKVVADFAAWLTAFLLQCPGTQQKDIFRGEEAMEENSA